LGATVRGSAVTAARGGRAGAGVGALAGAELGADGGADFPGSPPQALAPSNVNSNAPRIVSLAAFGIGNSPATNIVRVNELGTYSTCANGRADKKNGQAGASI
jgi:hypothetical protein